MYIYRASGVLTLPTEQQQQLLSPQRLQRVHHNNASSSGPRDESGIIMSGRPQMATMNGKRPTSMPPRHHQNEASSQQSQHFDLIKYIYESWNSVSKELDYHNQHGNSSNYRNAALVTYYQESEPNPQLKDFEPFDLEAYWNQRGVQVARNASS